MHYRLRQTKPFDDWIESVRDNRALAAVAKRLRRIQQGNLGDVRSVGQGVSELRVHYGPGYRIYFQLRDREIVLLLCGGDKSSQKRNIERAVILAKTEP